MKDDQPTRAGGSASREVVVLLAAAVLVAAFVAMRYGGLYGENDTAVFARAIRAVMNAGSLVPPRYAYSNGYGFPALATTLVHITGISVAQLQIFGGPLLMVWIVLPAWLAYRALTGSARGATLATALILIQPELMFALMRGTHEKFTRGLMFLGFYLLIRGILARQQWRRFASFLLAFYLVMYALITFNNLMAISFITALGLALVLTLLARQLAHSQADSTDATRKRLLFAIIISFILGFYFTFYAYPPARHAILLINSTTDRMAMLFLETEEVAVNPYGTISRAWISLPIYLTVTIANWLLLVFSFILWVRQTIGWWRNGAWPDEARVILLWSLYGAFGFLGAVSIIVDVSGAIATNLQHRMFPSFAMIAAPYVADWFIHRRAAGSEPGRGASYRPATMALAIIFAFLGLVAVAKATNEPAISNNWNYYRPAEFAGLEWHRRHSSDNRIRAAYDGRMNTALSICCDRRDEAWSFYSGSSIRALLISDVTRARGARLNASNPVEGDSLRVYDNGAAEVYRLRPRTPFQR